MEVTLSIPINNSNTKKLSMLYSHNTIIKWYSFYVTSHIILLANVLGWVEWVEGAWGWGLGMRQTS